MALVCAVTATVAGLNVASAAPQTTAHSNGSGEFLTTNTPYTPGQDPRTYQPAPAGFAPVFTEMLARHGARALSDASDISFLAEVIADARTEGDLKPLGDQLLTELDSLESANRTLGFGALSTLGKQEHAGLADRLLQRLPDLFAAAASTGRHIKVLNSGVPRAVDSGTAFTDELKYDAPPLAPLVDAPVVDKDTLYFHKAAVNADYTTWLKNDPTLHAKLDALTYSDESKSAAVACLDRLFAHDFVERLADGKYTFSDGAGGQVTRNAVDATVALFNVYAIAPGLSGEGTWHFGRFIDNRVAAHFAYVDDATSFYQKGPSFAGSTITFKMAKVLEDDFFAAIDAYRNGTSTDVARLRFAHAETLIPLAALLQLPGSDVPVAADDTFTYQENPWRGAKVAPYAGNMQWDVYRDSTGQLLVRMLYNEAESHFKADCQPYTPGGYFYALDELKRCYGA